MPNSLISLAWPAWFVYFGYRLRGLVVNVVDSPSLSRLYPMLIHAVLAFALLETALLAGLLWAFADRVPGARLLLVFLGGVELWVLGNELPHWFGLGWGPVAIALLSCCCKASH